MFKTDLNIDQYKLKCGVNAKGNLCVLCHFIRKICLHIDKGKKGCICCLPKSVKNGLSFCKHLIKAFPLFLYIFSKFYHEIVQLDGNLISVLMFHLKCFKNMLLYNLIQRDKMTWRMECKAFSNGHHL